MSCTHVSDLTWRKGGWRWLHIGTALGVHVGGRFKRRKREQGKGLRHDDGLQRGARSPRGCNVPSEAPMLLACRKSAGHPRWIQHSRKAADRPMIKTISLTSTQTRFAPQLPKYRHSNVHTNDRSVPCGYFAAQIQENGTERERNPSGGPAVYSFVTPQGFFACI